MNMYMYIHRYAAPPDAFGARPSHSNRIITSPAGGGASRQNDDAGDQDSRQQSSRQNAKRAPGQHVCVVRGGGVLSDAECVGYVC